MECGIETTDGLVDLTNPTPAPGKKREGGQNELSDALQVYQRSVMESTLVKKKIAFMEEERAEKKQKTMMDEWHNIHTTLRTLRADEMNPLLKERDRDDIEKDIARLVNRKNTLAIQLNLDYN